MTGFLTDIQFKENLIKLVLSDSFESMFFKMGGFP